MTLRKKADEEMPVSNRNFLNFPFTFFLMVKKIKIIPSRNRVAKGRRKGS